jgi:RimJ/RimL family protein N-acetyltransferase
MTVRISNATPADARAIAVVHVLAWQGAYRAQLAQEFLDALSVDARGYQRATLWVFTDNERALRFYRSLGFEEEGGSCKSFVLGGRSVQEVRYVRALGSAMP